MSFGLSAAAVGLIGVGLGATTAYLGSKATKKQAEIQADAIREGGQIDQAARNRAISQVLEIFGPSLVQFNESMQSSIDLFNQGRVSTGDLLTQSAQNVSQIAQQGGQEALNAMLGLPSPETVSTAQAPTAPEPTKQAPIVRQGTPQAVTTPGQAPTQLNIQPDGSVRPGTTQGINQVAQPQGVGQPQGIGTGMQTGIPGIPERPGRPVGAGGFGDDSIFGQVRVSNQNPNTGEPIEEQSVFQPQTPLEGEFIPREYTSQTATPLTMPQGTGAGLMGAEEAIRTGAGLGRTDLATGAMGALESLGTQSNIARGDVTGGRDFALNKIQQAIQASAGGIDRGIGAIQQGTSQGVGAIGAGVNRAVGFLNPYMSAGQEALNPYMSLSGARGQEAFDAALINDPAYNLALQESERALGRNAAVTGGIGSGNTKGRFQLNAQQQAAADIDRQLSRYLPIIGGGQAAATTAGGYTTQGGIASGNLYSQGGIAESNLAVRGGESEASLLSRMGDVGIQSAQQLSSIAQQLGISEAQVLQSLGGNLANIDVGTGQAIGGLRETAGINAANILQGTTGQQMGIEQGLTQNLANLDQQTLNNIINSMQSGAGTTLQSQQQLAQILANLGIGAGTSGQQTAIGIGQAEASGITNPIGNAINTGLGLYASGAFNQPTPYAPPSTPNLNLSQIPQMFSQGNAGFSQGTTGGISTPALSSYSGPINDPGNLYRVA